jgi:hypothetical protein
MEIPQIIGAGLIVIGAGLGIGKLVVQQWTLLVNQKLQERSKQLCLLQLHLLKVLVSQRYSLQLKQKTIVATVGCNYCFKINITIAAMQLN